MEYIDVQLSKPFGILLEENDPKIKGVYVKSLSEVRQCATPAHCDEGSQTTQWRHGWCI